MRLIILICAYLSSYILDDFLIMLILFFKKYFQHDAGRASLENAHNQMNEISCKIKSKNADRDRTQNELQINKVKASEARKAEQVCFYPWLHYMCINNILNWIYPIFFLAGIDQTTRTTNAS